MSLALVLALGALAVPPGESGGGLPQDFELEELVTPAGSRAGLPNLVRGADGHVYLSWVERRDPHDPRAGTLFFASWSGDAWSEPQRVAAGDDWFLNWADFPSLGALEDGTLVAHWLERTGTGTYDYGARFSLRGSGGATWTAPAWLHDHTGAGEHGFVSFVPLGNRFGAVWLDGRDAGPGGATALFFRTIARTGDLGEEELLDDRVCDCCPTGLGAREDAPLAVYRDRSEAETRDVSLVERGKDGWSSPTPVHDDGWEIAGCPVNGPRIAVGPDELAVAWYTGAGGGAARVLAAFRGVEAFGPPVSVDDGAPLGRVDAALLADGSLAVAWLEHEEGGASWRVRRVRARGGRGALVGEAVVLARVSSDRASGHLRMVAEGDTLFLAWSADPGTVRTAKLVRPTN